MLATAALALLGAACAPPIATPPPTTTLSETPVPPTVSLFNTVGVVGSAPALVTFSWTVVDGNNDELTCLLDGNGDGITDQTINRCDTDGQTRNVAVASATSVDATLKVLDGTSPPVVAHRVFNVSAGPAELYNVTLRKDPSMAPQVVAAFTAAKNYWEHVITRGVPDVTTNLSGCVPPGTPTLPNPLDDIVIDVDVYPFMNGGVPDGPGGVLGLAGPTCTSLTTGLTLHGKMAFDSADVADLLADGSFTDVVRHEMAHVLGFGTVWNMSTPARTLAQGLGGTNPRFVGTRAMAEWSAQGGVSAVPLEAGDFAGTAGTHWRESVFDCELMTGYLDHGVNPVSAITIASLADLGYHVDITQAEPYDVPGYSALRRPGRAPASTDLEGTILRPPMESA